ncbi:histidine utilization repressor [Rhizobium sp. YIM 134829]|uniref:histidine utilization repressor n=1 Tax=Rhizobium sp. YIM 134829 TaxID=3390453 RepID=UPI0039799C70
MQEAGALYERVKAEIRARIDSGEWPPQTRVPSENEIVARFGVSRMTAHRALRELASEGLILRIQGRGSFVAPQRHRVGTMGVRNIAEDIRARGGVHRAELVLAQQEICGPDLADALEITLGLPVFHSIVVHHEDEVPIQLEDRFVNPKVAPDYLSQDFTAQTPNAYLTAVAPLSRSEQSIEAVAPQPWECRLLAIGRADPCLLVRRRTWSAEKAATAVRLLHPGTRYRLESSL